jgi:hypothetical protein
MQTNPLDQLIELCEELENIRNTEARVQADLESLQEKGDKLSKTLIPDLMKSLGVTNLKMLNGSKIETVPDIHASIRKDKMPEVLTWLKAHGSAAIAKEKLVVKVEDAELLSAVGIGFDRDASIHPSTLRAFVKEQLEAAPDQFPRELFGVYEGSKTVITAAR